MLTLYDHIQQLRAELRNCMNTRERVVLTLELAHALAEQAKREVELDAVLANILEPASK